MKQFKVIRISRQDGTTEQSSVEQATEKLEPNYYMKNTVNSVLKDIIQGHVKSVDLATTSFVYRFEIIE